MTLTRTRLQMTANFDRGHRLTIAILEADGDPAPQPEISNNVVDAAKAIGVWVSALETQAEVLGIDDLSSVDTPVRRDQTPAPAQNPRLEMEVDLLRADKEILSSDIRHLRAVIRGEWKRYALLESDYQKLIEESLNR